MKRLFRLAAIGTLALSVGVLGLGSFADSAFKTPAEAVASLTGQSVESVITKRAETGKTYGTIAQDAGKLEEFKKEMLALKKANLDAQVKAGRLTQAQADAIMKAIEENQATCDGTGGARNGQRMGAKFGSNGAGLGNGGFGCGMGGGRGFGSGLNNNTKTQ